LPPAPPSPPPAPVPAATCRASRAWGRATLLPPKLRDANFARAGREAAHLASPGAPVAAAWGALDSGLWGSAAVGVAPATGGSGASSWPRRRRAPGVSRASPRAAASRLRPRLRARDRGDAPAGGARPEGVSRPTQQGAPRPTQQGAPRATQGFFFFFSPPTKK
jgi:hypothetical protein